MIWPFRISGSLLGTERPEELLCPHCQSRATTSLNVFARYLSLAGLPLFPTSRAVISHCSSCGNTVTKESATPSYLKFASEAKKKETVPWWTFSGLILIAGMVLAGQYTFNRYLNRSLYHISHPEPQDLYYLRTPQGLYSLMKLDTLSGDSFYFLQNRYEIDKRSAIQDLDTDSSYLQERHLMMRADLLRWWKEDTLLHVKRP